MTSSLKLQLQILLGSTLILDYTSKVQENLKLRELVQLDNWQLEKKDIRYSYFDTYAAIQDLIQSPISYEIKTTYEIGKLNAEFSYLPISIVCSNRQNQLF
ncbi:hypothetical protein Ahy_B03g064577 [Arachis hypogaea]|uniref:Uncharacterized protein n=1 Tax=Arachis hypogaea TaxID=3818 RepID=A0A444ZZV6_ARAHY|nr:hypothetical protein Ahy_B03g064577 [Arachis hypogaea]